MTTCIHFLHDLAFDSDEAGQKAAQLHRLAMAGFQVPAGFAIPHELSLDGLGMDSLMAAIEHIGGFPVAVRSSGNLEDLEGASFAGQYLSFLDVSSPEELVRRTVECRESASSPQVAAYLHKNGLADKTNRLAVLVQKMVPARLAGVGFSIHPISGREEHGLVECCKGLGEKLVSGHMTPSRYVIDLETGGIVEEEVGDDGARLSIEEATHLANILLCVQAHFGCPQDIEWAIDGTGKHWMLQSRPVTQVQWRTDVEEFTNADLKDGGISARVCTPLMFSLYHRALSTSMPAYISRIGLMSRRKAFSQNWLEMFYGRGYWNASATKLGLSVVPGFDEKSFDEDLGIQKTYGPSGPVRVPVNLKTIVRAIPIALALQNEYARHLRLVATFGTAFNAEQLAWKKKSASFAATADDDFYADLEKVLGFQQQTESAYFTTIYNNSNAQSDLKVLLRKMDSAIGGETAFMRLLAGLTDVSHMNMQRGWLRLYRAAALHKIDSPEFEASLAGFLDENDFHSDAELDLTTPRWGERPEIVREHVGRLLRTGIEPADPDSTATAQHHEFEAEIASVSKRIAANRWSRIKFSRAFTKKLERARSYLSGREAMREYSTRAYYIARLYILEAGRRLAAKGKLRDASEVFLLNAQELVDLSLGRAFGATLLKTVDYRAQMYRGYRNFTPPNEIGSGVRQRTEDSFHENAADGSAVFKGLGCSPGQVEGIVRVIDSMEQIDRIEKGDILVTRFTDPGWTPVLGLVSGIVTEVGGMLSHAAVIGREYGIPAVLNLPGATRRLTSGQRVRVNGSNGVVMVLNT